MVRCKEHAHKLLVRLGFKVRGVYWVESAGDSGEGLDTIGYVNSKNEPRRAFIEARPDAPKGRPKWKVKNTAEGWE